MKKLQSLNNPLFKTIEGDMMKKVQGGMLPPVGTYTLPEVKITGHKNGPSTDDCSGDDAPGGDDGKDS